MSNWLRNKDFIWCPGCPNIWLAGILARQFEKLKFKKQNTWLISGIGCTGRMATYFNCHTAHTTHGRAIAVAEGIKIANPKREALVVSGDGDLLGIGLNHLIHTARRQVNITVICVNNYMYAMTGGQSHCQQIDIKKILASIKNTYYEKVKVFDKENFEKAFKKTQAHKGFSFIELDSFCRIHGFE